MTASEVKEGAGFWTNAGMFLCFVLCGVPPEPRQVSKGTREESKRATSNLWDKALF